MSVSKSTSTMASAMATPTKPGNLNVDDFIDRLINKGIHPNALTGKAANKTVIREDECLELCLRCRELFMSEPPFLEVKAPTNVCGDTHGQFEDLIRLFHRNGFPSADKHYLFLGDYVDRGPQSLETVSLLMAYKLRNPTHVQMLRGNHEARVINRMYGFYDECKRRFPQNGSGTRLWHAFQDVFNSMPLCALINKRIFCMHGGLSSELVNWDQLKKIRRPTEIPESGLLCDLLWADPDVTVSGYAPSPRMTSQIFGKDVVKKFCANMQVDLIARAHQVVNDGYEFFANRQLVTIFSAPYYCSQFENSAAIMKVGEDLECSFYMLEPTLTADDPTPTVNPDAKRKGKGKSA